MLSFVSAIKYWSTFEIPESISFCRLKTAKSCFYFASALNAAAQEREEKRLRALREAEAMVQREQEKSTKLT